MVFKCQEDSFLTEFRTRVISCEPEGTGYQVIFEDTVLFPEGGGQPTDHGWVDDLPVKSVIRKGATAIHFVEAASGQVPFQPGQEVCQRVDWERRFDHMQQHSGQHLITAIFDREFGFNTKSWWLGTEDSYVNLNTMSVTREQLDKVERICNKLIVDCTAVSVAIYQPDDPALKSDVTRATRGLPEDVSGPLRVVTIDGIESNMCCGTHVRNLGQLQAVKFLNVEKGKSKYLVHFLVGGRVLRKLTECYDREVEFNGLLQGGPPSHVDLLRKLQTTVRAVQKSCRKMSTELAQLEADKINLAPDPKPKFYSMHRRDGPDSDFVNEFLRCVKVPNCFLFATNAEDAAGLGAAQMMLQGRPEDVASLGHQIMTLLEGKGYGKGTRFNAKVNRLEAIDRCHELIEDYFNAKDEEKEKDGEK